MLFRSQPLVRVNMGSGYSRTGGPIARRIAGRELLLKKHQNEFKNHPDLLAWHYFQIGLWYRSVRQYGAARDYFWRAFRADSKIRYVLHYISMLGGGFLYGFYR